MRKIGLFYKQIGKKLGVDPRKEEIVKVYKAVDVATTDKINKSSPPTPLWYLFNSELDVVSSSLPKPSTFFESEPQQHL